VGLSLGELEAAFCTGLALLRQHSTCFPIPALTIAFAIFSGTHNVSFCIKELFGTGTNIVLELKNEANVRLDIFVFKAVASHSDIRTGGLFTNPSFLRASITFLEF
jgi:hypothetical protein